MRKALILALFLLTLLPVLDGAGYSTVSAQSMSYESGSWWLPDIGVDGTRWETCPNCNNTYDPDDPEGHMCSQQCEYCSEIVSVDRYDAHLMLMHPNLVPGGTVGGGTGNGGNGNGGNGNGGNGNDNDTKDGGELPEVIVHGKGNGTSGNTSETGGAPGGTTSGTTSGTGNSESENNELEGDDSPSQPSPEESDIEMGKSAFDKMEKDIREGNYQVWTASVESSEKLQMTERLSNTFLGISATDFVLNGLSAIRTNPMYYAFSQSLAHAGIGVSMAQTAVLLFEKGASNLTVGDMFSIAGGFACGISVYVGYINLPLGVALNGAGIALGLTATFFFLNDMYIPLENGYVLHLKRITA